VLARKRLAVITMALAVVALLALLAVDSTTLPHAIAGLVFASLLASHLALNRAWIKQVTRRLTTRRNPERPTPVKTRADYLLDAAGLALVVLVMTTGIVALLNPASTPEAGHAGAALVHAVTTKLALAWFVIHAVRHRAWLKATLRPARKA
jgi:hypothetical protein